MSITIAKSGWMYRQTSILKKWKRCWFILTSDGYFRYYESASSVRAEDSVHLGRECLAVAVGNQNVDYNVKPPENHNRDWLLSLTFRHKNWNLCADSVDDAKAWEFALDQARVLAQGQFGAISPMYGDTFDVTANSYYPVYTGDTSVRYVAQTTPVYYYPVPGANGGTYVVNGGQPGGTQVIYQARNHRTGYRPGYGYGGIAMGAASGMALGTMTGLAVGSMLYSPCLW